MLTRSRRSDVASVLLGVLGLLVKGRVGHGLVHSYGGNVAVSFALFFLFKLPSIPARFRVAAAAGLALLATESFEAANGFGFMHNTYDPADYLANGVGVVLAAVVNFAMQRLTQPRGDSLR